MLYRLRQALAVIAMAGFGTCLALVLGGRLHLFVPGASADKGLTNALYLLSTLVQAIASITAVTIAVLFLTAQSSARAQQARAIVAIYGNRTTILVILFLVVTMATGILTLAALPRFTASADYRVVDINILMSITALLLLAPLVLVQIENLDPYLLAVKLSKGVVPRAIRNYRLAKVQPAPHEAEGLKYQLHIWGHEHGRIDPLGSFHEVIMVAVAAKDRVLLSALIRLILGRIASVAGVPYARYARPLPRRAGPIRRAVDQLWARLVGLRGPSAHVAVALHLMHYVVRRARNLKSELGPLDGVRKQFVVNLLDLVQALILAPQSGPAIDLCLLAILHISAHYGDAPPYGEQEPLVELYPVCCELYAGHKREQAFLALEILGYLSVKSRYLQPSLRAIGEAQLSDKLRGSYAYSRAMYLAGADDAWRPVTSWRDPWYYLWREHPRP